jgi:hypothetical protein
MHVLIYLESTVPRFKSCPRQTDLESMILGIKSVKKQE